MPIREKLGISPGTWLEIEADQGMLRASVIQPIASKTTVSSGLGLAGYQGRRLAIEEMDPLRALEQTEEDER
jgi:bifunctional DNA-binding transcriptional regulator/antitoxin component of YhaV-PrlF toxin-antitoxin module